MKITNIIIRIFLIFNFQFVIFNCFAQTDSLEVHKIKGKDYYIHVVEKGESLYFIHKKYDVPIEVIKKQNPNVLDGLSIGEKVFVPVKKDSEYEIKTDGNYITHEVKKKQTLYSIAKLYKVKQKALITANPDVINGLKEGQIIKIPIANIKKEKKQKKEGSNYRTHYVKKGETLYSLSKLYKTIVDSIKLVNDGLKKGLKVGETIYIPIVKDTNNSIVSIGEKLEEIFTDTVVTKKSEYKIALVLPFYLDENDEITEHRNALEKKSIYPKSKFAIEFYNGFIMAIDSISTDSCKFKVYVYDTKGSDSSRIQSILLNPELKTFDLIVGPLFDNNFNQFAEFAKQNKIPIVSPVKQSNKTLLGNEFVFKAIPSKSTTIKQICTLVVDSFKTQNLLAIEFENAKEKSLVEIYVKGYNNKILSSENDTSIYSSIKVLKINTNISDIVSHLKRDKNNVIFIPAAHQTFITTLFSSLTTILNKRDYKDYKVTLIGMEEWMNYGNIDLEYFQTLNVHFCSNKYVNYKDSITATFITNYITITETYPSNNTFLGFDLAYYFGGNLLNYGSLFSSASLVPYEGMAIRLNFFKTGIESGYENTNSYLLKFDDFTLKNIY